MATIESIRNNKSMKSSSQPYPTALCVKILDKLNVGGKLHVIIGDATGVMKLVATGVASNEQFPAVGTAVVIRNYSKGHTCLFTTKAFTVTRARDFELPPNIEAQFLHSESRSVQLKDVDESMLNTTITVEGTVVGVRHIFHIKEYFIRKEINYVFLVPTWSVFWHYLIFFWKFL